VPRIADVSNQGGSYQLCNARRVAYVDASPFKTGRQALAELLEKEARPPDDWVIRKGEFMSFRDPRTGPVARIVDVGSIDEVSPDDIGFPDDEADERIFIELLRRTLGAQLDGLLVYSKDQKAFYFAADAEKIEQTYHYMSLKQRASADVVKKYERDGKLKYVRHHAFEPRFWRPPGCQQISLLSLLGHETCVQDPPHDS
jgi:hypothetical protein